MRILIGDGHALVRAGIGRLLSDLLSPVEVVEAGTLAQVLARADAGFDLCLLDPDLPGGGGDDGIRAFRERHPSVPLVVLSAGEEPDGIVSALRAGAQGYIPTSSSPKVMLGAIRFVLDTGGPFVPASLALGVGPVHPRMSSPQGAPGGGDRTRRAPARWPARTDQPAGGSAPAGTGEPASRNGTSGHDSARDLTPRQREVLALIARGKSNRDIAQELGITQGTAKLHVTSVLKTLGAHNRTEAALMAKSLDPSP